ncbi:hypothetical protein DVH24_021329 [Malus domestica]|uniref:Uncharacterized protein n=1 Tax=Malus domestica TaxID=3750 RepID=A0A498JX61_MALDO|nr:hypothetical protein DVH24_021329 [Malus domestica]
MRILGDGPPLRLRVCVRERYGRICGGILGILLEREMRQRQRERFQRFENSSLSHKLCKSIFLSFLSTVCIFLSPIINAGSCSETFALLQNSFEKLGFEFWGFCIQDWKPFLIKVFGPKFTLSARTIKAIE